jgi:hypothetical protein
MLVHLLAVTRQGKKMVLLVLGRLLAVCRLSACGHAPKNVGFQRDGFKDPAGEIPRDWLHQLGCTSEREEGRPLGSNLLYLSLHDNECAPSCDPIPTAAQDDTDSRP